MPFPAAVFPRFLARRPTEHLSALALVALLAGLTLGAPTSVLRAARGSWRPTRPERSARPTPADSTAAPLALTVSSETPEATRARDHCLSTEFAPGLAWECGDLRATYALPAVTVRGRSYTPTLLYNSAYAHPVPLVAATLTLDPALVARGDSVELTVWMDGQPVRRRRVDARLWAGAGRLTRRVTLAVDAASRPTGAYPFTVTAVIGGDTVRAGGRLAVVNRAASPFGAGWWLAGFEQLLPLQSLSLALADSLLWVGGDGSTRVYRRSDPWKPVFKPDAFAGPDSIALVSGGFVRALPHGAAVHFDEAGVHRATRDAAGNEVAFDVAAASSASVDGTGDAGPVGAGPSPGHAPPDRTPLLERIRIRGPRAELHYAFVYAATDGLPKGGSSNASLTSGGVPNGGAPNGGPPNGRWPAGVRPDGVPVLVRVDAPGAGGAPRGVRLTTVARQVQAITGPDDAVVRYVYEPPSETAVGVLTRRTDRSGAAWSFAYDSAARRLSRAWIDVAEAVVATRAWSPQNGGTASARRTTRGDGSDAVRTRRIVHRFGTAAAMGLADWSPEPLAPALVHSWYDGPRDDLVDVTLVWQDQFGQPTMIRTPDGGLTRIARDDVRFPGLVTRVAGPTGLVTTAAYDDGGHPTSVTVRDPRGDGRDATTRYAWVARWDALTETVSPEGVTTRYGYDAAGQRVWVEDGRGPAGRVWLFPGASGLLDSVRTPLGARATRYAYDALGNLAAEETPGGAVTRHLRDALGRDTLTLAPIDPPVGPFSPAPATAPSDPATTPCLRARRVVYDLADRVVREEHVGPPVPLAPYTAMGATPAETLAVTRTYDAEGRLLALERVAYPDLARTGSALRTAWTYDALGRALVERAPDGAADSTWYDGAGNVVRRVTRRGRVLTYEYDAMNRLTARVLPAVSYPTAVIDGWRFPADDLLDPSTPAGPAAALGDVEIPADTERFAYDAAGRLLRATNRDAVVYRRYDAGGALVSDSVVVRVGAGADTASRAFGVRAHYDLDGRRVGLRLPAELAAEFSPPGSLGSSAALGGVGTLGAGPTLGGALEIGYAYDLTGALAVVTDPLGQRFGYTYDLEGRVARLASPGDVAEHAAFDVEGRLSGRALLQHPDSARPDTLWSSALEYDARGKVVRARTRDAGTGRETRVDAAYSGLGSLAWLRQQSDGTSPEGTTALASTLGEASQGAFKPALKPALAPAIHEEFIESDAFGQALLRWESDAPGVRYGTRYSYSLRNEGRLLDRWELTPGTTGRDHNDYDAAGNLLVRQRTAYVPGPTAHDTTTVSTVAVSYYGADERLRFVDERATSRSNDRRSAHTLRTTRTVEETRYDALGRRVELRVRRDVPPEDRTPSSPASAGAGSVAASGTPDSSSASGLPSPGSASAEPPTVSGASRAAPSAALASVAEPAEAWREEYVWDGDQLLVERRVAEGDIALGDAANAGGGAVGARGTSRAESVTLYTHGAALDDPLSIIYVAPRAAGGDTLVVRMPHRDWAGGLGDGVLIDAAGRVVPRDVSRAAGLGSVAASLPMNLPASLLGEQRTPGGAQYRRHRYFDPVQGRFTQEDPLGIWGGPSPYGTGGDPLSYGDPFGLCRVEVRYARLGALLGKAWHHAYVVTTAPDLTRLFFRAGPGGAGPSGGTPGQLGAAVLGVVGNALGLSSASAASSGAAGAGLGWGAIHTMWGYYEPGAIDWDPGQPPATRLVDDSAPCDGYVASFARTLGAIENRRIAYNPFTTNSNAVVRELLAKAGLTPGAPIVWAPGWNTVLLR